MTEFLLPHSGHHIHRVLLLATLCAVIAVGAASGSRADAAEDTVLAPLPPGLRSRLLGLISDEEQAHAHCLDPRRLAAIVATAPDYAIDIMREAAPHLRPNTPVATDGLGRTHDSRDSNQSAGDGDPCACVADVAAEITTVVPNQASGLYKIFVDTAPNCREQVTVRMQNALLGASTFVSRSPASSGQRPSVVVPGAPTCSDTGTCSTPLPRGDTGDESPTRLGHRG